MPKVEVDFITFAAAKRDEVEPKLAEYFDALSRSPIITSGILISLLADFTEFLYTLQGVTLELEQEDVDSAEADIKRLDKEVELRLTDLLDADDDVKH